MTKYIWIVMLAALVLVIAACDRQVPRAEEAEEGGAPEQTVIEEQAAPAPAETSEPQAADEAAEETAEPATEQAAQQPAADESADTVQYAGLSWYTDLEDAKKAAAAEDKQIFINFTGSDWCVWCHRLVDEVLSKPAFQKEAKEDYVFLLADFPSDDSKLSEEQKQKNRQLLQYYGVQGFPTILLARPSGKAYAMTGYQEGGPEAYLRHLEEIKREYGGS